MSRVIMMESTYRDLAERALALLQGSQEYRVVILLVGAPGSGKSTVAQRCVDIINELHRTRGKVVMGSANGGGTQYPRIECESQRMYDPLAQIDYEDECFEPSVEMTTKGCIVRGRGGHDTAIKVEYNMDDGRGVSSSDDAVELAQVVPMDGFHLPRRVLDRFKDRENAYRRRGSPFTFDSSLLVELISILKLTSLDISSRLSPLDTLNSHHAVPDIYIPSFDHMEKDPKMFGTCIKSSSRILIIEGLYLLLNNPVWEKIPKLLEPTVQMPNSCTPQELNFSESTNRISQLPVPEMKNHEFWKLLIDDNKILSRLGSRHLRAGIVSTLQEGEDRVRVNDLPNGQKVYSESFQSDIDIISIDDPNEVAV